MKPDFSTLDRNNIVAFIGDIFDRRGGEEYLGEPVTMAEHMLQGATIAEQNGMPEEIIVGALLHDIGHFTSEFGTYHPDDTEDRHHEDAGADVLEQFFPTVITDCCRYHVAAKRYLCATKPEYLVVGHFEIRFLYGPRFFGAGSLASTIATRSAISQRRSVRPASIAGVTFNV